MTIYLSCSFNYKYLRKTKEKFKRKEETRSKHITKYFCLCSFTDEIKNRQTKRHSCCIQHTGKYLIAILMSRHHFYSDASIICYSLIRIFLNTITILPPPHTHTHTCMHAYTHTHTHTHQKMDNLTNSSSEITGFSTFLSLLMSHPYSPESIVLLLLLLLLYIIYIETHTMCSNIQCTLLSKQSLTNKENKILLQYF